MREARAEIPGAQGLTPPVEMSERVRAEIKALGESGAARRLGVNVATLARLAGGLPVRAGTLALVREGLAATIEGASQ